MLVVVDALERRFSVCDGGKGEIDDNGRWVTCMYLCTAEGNKRAAC